MNSRVWVKTTISIFVSYKLWFRYVEAFWRYARDKAFQMKTTVLEFSQFSYNRFVFSDLLSVKLFLFFHFYRLLKTRFNPNKMSIASVAAQIYIQSVSSRDKYHENNKNNLLTCLVVSYAELAEFTSTNCVAKRLWSKHSMNFL